MARSAVIGSVAGVVLAAAGLGYLSVHFAHSELQKVEQRYGLRNVRFVESAAARENSVDLDGGLVLQPLRAIRTDDAKPDGGGEDAAARQEEGHALRRGERNLKHSKHRSEERRVVAT